LRASHASGAAFVAAAIALAVACGSGQAAQTGIRHSVVATLLSFSDTIGARSSVEEPPPRADLRVFVSISDHAIESRFYGTVQAQFLDVDPSAGAGEVLLWEDARCHRERGIPKISVVRIEGAIRRGERSIPLTALGRQLGRRVPLDEIIERKGPSDDDGRTLATIDATTKASGIAVRIRLKGEPCVL
jgi:hypothetical protein